MAEEIKKVIEIKVKGERTVQDLKNNIKELQNALVNLDAGTEDYDKVVQQLTLDQSKLSEVMNAGKATVAGAAGSYNALKKEMADLKKVWAQLAPSAERDEVGQRIKGLNDQLKQLDASTGNFQRNVGDYKNAFVSAFNVMGGSVNGLVGQVGNLAQLFKSFGKGGAIGLALAGAGGLISAMASGIKSSEETTKKWRKELAQVKPIINDLDAGLERMGRGAAKIASFFLTILGAITNFANFIASGFKYNQVMDSANNAIKEAVELEEREIANETELNNLAVLQASAQTRLNELKAIAADTDHKSYEERKAALDEIDAIEETYEKRRVAAAREAYDIQVKNRKGEHASAEEAKKERELYIAYLQAKADAQAADIAREKEIYQLQKEAGEEALDYRIRILEQERDMWNTRISMVEAGTQEELQYRLKVNDLELEIDKATAEKEKKNMTLKYKQLEAAELKYYSNRQQIIDDFNATTLQRIKDATDAVVANEVNDWQKTIRQLQGLMTEYQTKMNIGKPTTQTSEEWLKELAQMRENIRKTWLNGINDMFDEVDKKVQDRLTGEFKLWEQNTSIYLFTEIQTYRKFFETIALERDQIIGNLSQMEGESDEQFAARRLEIEKLFDAKIFEYRKKAVEDYQKWYYKTITETDTQIILDTRQKYEDYIANIPHTVWEYMFKPNENESENLQKELDNAQSRFIQAKHSIETMMTELWTKPMEDFNWDEAFDLLPDDVQKDYISKLENYVNAEKAILEKRKEGWQELGRSISSIFGSLGDIYEEDIKRRQKNGKINEQQAKKEFENVKALQIAQAVINTLAGSVGAFLQASQTYPAPYGQIIGGVAAAAATAAGIAQIAKIQNTEYGGSSSVSSPSAAATPVVDEYNPQYSRNITTASDVDTLNAGLEKANLYVKVTDIDAAQEQGRVRTSESSW